MMETPQELTLGDFSGWVGHSFVVTADGHRLMLALEAAEPLQGSPRPGGAFRLEFSGPAEAMLGQGVFMFEIETRRYELFIVPLGRDARGARYEAVFY